MTNNADNEVAPEWMCPPFWTDQPLTSSVGIKVTNTHVHGSTGVPLLPCGCVIPPEVGT